MAAQKVGELLKTYNLSMDRVFLGATKCITDSVITKHRRRGATNDYIWTIGSFCDCKMWFSSWDNNRHITYYFFGLPTDTEMAKFLYSVVDAAMETETEKYRQSAEYREEVASMGWVGDRRGRGRHLTISFRHGLANKIAQRLHKMMDERHKEEEAESLIALPLASQDAELPGEATKQPTSACTSLVLIKRKKVDEEYEQLGLKLRNHPRSSS